MSKYDTPLPGARTNERQIGKKKEKHDPDIVNGKYDTYVINFVYKSCGWSLRGLTFTSTFG